MPRYRIAAVLCYSWYNWSNENVQFAGLPGWGFLEDATAPNQNIIRLVIDNKQFLSFDLNNVQPGPLSLKFTDYRIDTVYVDCRMDIFSIFEAIGSLLEEIRFSRIAERRNGSLSLNFAYLFTTIRNHWVNLHTFVHIGHVLETNHLVDLYASLLISYGDQIRCGCVEDLTTESIRNVFLSCPNLRTKSVTIPNNYYSGEEDLPRTVMLASRAARIRCSVTSEFLPHNVVVFNLMNVPMHSLGHWDLQWKTWAAELHRVVQTMESFREPPMLCPILK